MERKLGQLHVHCQQREHMAQGAGRLSWKAEVTQTATLLIFPNRCSLLAVRPHQALRVRRADWRHQEPTLLLQEMHRWLCARVQPLQRHLRRTQQMWLHMPRK